MFRLRPFRSECVGTSGKGSECWMKLNSLSMAPTGETGGGLVVISMVQATVQAMAWRLTRISWHPLAQVHSFQLTQQLRADSSRSRI
jgi:hypothetical protein